MVKVSLNKNEEFLVGEDKVLVYILASLFFLLFLYGLIDAILHHFQQLTYMSFIFLIALAPAILFLRKGKNNRIYIRINKKGIYQDEKLITDWSHLLKVYISQKERVASIQDNFVLVVEYRKVGINDGFRRKIPLTNTQNKSEEEVLEAVNFFWKVFKYDAFDNN
ncbi:MAG: hypothetical protein WBC06_15630 [Chitinophagaceae bacterium]